MTADFTNRIILQGRALVRAIEAPGTFQPSGPFERALARLRPIVPAAPSCAGHEILSASEAIRDNRPRGRPTTDETSIEVAHYAESNDRR